MNISVESNIVTYLFITAPCPVCHEEIEVSLGMLHRKELGFCPHCITPMVLKLKYEWLEPFVSSFDNLLEQLKEHELPLTLSDEPVVTTSEPD